MFTGLIEDIGIIASLVRENDVHQMMICGSRLSSSLELGQSVAVSGACLTVTKIAGKTFTLEVTSETMSKTKFSKLTIGGRVNLERALKIGDRLDGHLVTGHVDAMAKVLRVDNKGTSRNIFFEVPPHLGYYIVPKGSVAIDGVSLTVAKVEDLVFSVAFISTTLRETTIGDLRANDLVNIETDILGKYVSKMIAAFPRKEKTLERDSITLDKLRELGW